MTEQRVARILLDAWEQDLRACEVLSGAPGINDSVVGFHAQQAVEKALKAVLADAGITFRRTHDISELLDLLTDHAVEPPPHADWLDELNPYAVAIRYGLTGVTGLDREGALAAAREVWKWAADRLAKPSG
jgi:HEPN domain-containing protein